VINTTTDALIAEYDTHPSAAARNHSSWITRDRKTLYLVNEGVNEVTAINASTGKMIFSLAVGNRPSEVLVAPGGRTAYVSVRGSENKIKAIDLKKHAVVGEVSLGQQPDTLQLTPNGKLLLVGMRGLPAELDVVAVPSLTVVAAVTVAEAGTLAGHNWISANGRYSFISYEGGSRAGCRRRSHERPPGSRKVPLSGRRKASRRLLRRPGKHGGTCGRDLPACESHRQCRRSRRRLLCQGRGLLPRAADTRRAWQREAFCNCGSLNPRSGEDVKDRGDEADSCGTAARPGERDRPRPARQLAEDGTPGHCDGSSSRLKAGLGCRTRCYGPAVRGAADLTDGGCRARVRRDSSPHFALAPSL
jgi:Lactonase, 7-bladed beta-propeller